MDARLQRRVQRGRCVGSYGQEVGSLLPCGANDRSADGRRFSPIVDAEVASEVCPLFFRLGQQDTLARLCADVEFEAIERQWLQDSRRIRHRRGDCAEGSHHQLKEERGVLVCAECALT
jgi:hypothetical protein